MTSKLKLSVKNSLELMEFFSKIFVEISSSLKTLIEDKKIDGKVKEMKFPDDSLIPFGEKASLVLLSVLNSLKIDQI